MHAGARRSRHGRRDARATRLSPPRRWEYTPSRFTLHAATRVRLRFRHWNWIPAFAGMTMPGTGALNFVIPAKAGIHSASFLKSATWALDFSPSASPSRALGGITGISRGIPSRMAPAPKAWGASCSDCSRIELTYLFSATFPDQARISFVFIHIPASPTGFPQRSFVFNDIPASFVQKREFLLNCSPMS